MGRGRGSGSSGAGAARAQARGGGSPRPRVQKKKRGGSAPGGTKNMGGKDAQKLRRAAVKFKYLQEGLQDAPLPPLKMGRPKKGEPEHVAVRIAKSVVLPGAKGRLSSRTVMDWLQEIKAVGWDNWDPMTDGRSDERPTRQTLNDEETEEMMFKIRKKGTVPDCAQMLSDARAVQGKEPVPESTYRDHERRIGVKVRKTQTTSMQSEDSEKREVKGRKIVCEEYIDRIEAFKAGKETTDDGLPALDTRSIFWWDEHHSRCSLGANSKWQRLYPVQKNAQGEYEYTPISEGGETEPLVLVKKGKFMPQACGLNGVCLVDGKPYAAAPFRYSSTVVSKKRWEKEIRRCGPTALSARRNRPLTRRCPQGDQALPRPPEPAVRPADWPPARPREPRQQRRRLELHGAAAGPPQARFGGDQEAAPLQMDQHGRPLRSHGGLPRHKHPLLTFFRPSRSPDRTACADRRRQQSVQGHAVGELVVHLPRPAQAVL